MERRITGNNAFTTLIELNHSFVDAKEYILVSTLILTLFIFPSFHRSVGWSVGLSFAPLHKTASPEPSRATQHPNKAQPSTCLICTYEWNVIHNTNKFITEICIWSGCEERITHTNLVRFPIKNSCRVKHSKIHRPPHFTSTLQFSFNSLHFLPYGAFQFNVSEFPHIELQMLLNKQNRFHVSFLEYSIRKLYQCTSI